MSGTMGAGKVKKMMRKCMEEFMTGNYTKKGKPVVRCAKYALGAGPRRRRVYRRKPRRALGDGRGNTAWIKFVKQVEKKYGLSYKDALTKASQLRRAKGGVLYGDMEACCGY